MIVSSDVLMFRINPVFNEKRYYRMLLLPSLFGEVQLLREFGRIGLPGRVMIETFETESEASRKLESIARQKLRRGYRLRMKVSYH